MTTGGGMAGEIGALFVSVVPSLKGAGPAATAGGTDVARAFTTAFGIEAARGLPGEISNALKAAEGPAAAAMAVLGTTLTSKLSAPFAQAGTRSAQAFSQTFLSQVEMGLGAAAVAGKVANFGQVFGAVGAQTGEVFARGFTDKVATGIAALGSDAGLAGLVNVLSVAGLRGGDEFVRSVATRLESGLPLMAGVGLNTAVARIMSGAAAHGGEIFQSTLASQMAATASVLTGTLEQTLTKAVATIGSVGSGILGPAVFQQMALTAPAIGVALRPTVTQIETMLESAGIAGSSRFGVAAAQGIDAGLTKAVQKAIPAMGAVTAAFEGAGIKAQGAVALMGERYAKGIVASLGALGPLVENNAATVERVLSAAGMNPGKMYSAAVPVVKQALSDMQMAGAATFANLSGAAKLSSEEMAAVLGSDLAAKIGLLGGGAIRENLQSALSGVAGDAKVAATAAGEEVSTSLAAGIGSMVGPKVGGAMKSGMSVLRSIGGGEGAAAGAAVGAGIVAGVAGFVVLGVHEFKKMTEAAVASADSIGAAFGQLTAGKMPDFMSIFDNLEETAFKMANLAGLIAPAALPFVLVLDAIKPAVDKFKELGGQWISTMLDIGKSYQEASRVIAGSEISTEQIDSLVEATRDIMASGAVVTFKDVAENIGRLGANIQGLDMSQLKELATTFAEAEELVGEIDPTKLAGIMNAFNIPTEQTNEELTKLVNTAIMTGVKFNMLTDEMTRTGPAMLELGYGADQTATFFARMAQEGDKGTRLIFAMNDVVKRVNDLVEKGNFKDIKEGWNSVMGTVKYYMEEEDKALAAHDKAAAGKAHAGALSALETFASPSTAAMLLKTIRQGIFDTPSLMKVLAGTDQDLSEGVEHTKSLGQAFQVLGQQIQASMEPVGFVLAGALREADTGISSWIADNQDKIAGWAANITATFLTGMSKIAAFVMDIFAFFGPLLNSFKNFAVSFVTGLEAILQPIVKSIGGILSVFGDNKLSKPFQDAAKLMDASREGLQAAWDFNVENFLDKGADAATRFRDGVVPGLNAKLYQTADAFKAVHAISQVLAHDVEGKITDRFTAIRNGAGVLGTPTKPELQLSGDAKEWAEVKKQLASQGIDIDYNDKGVVGSTKFPGGKKAEDAWDQWWEQNIVGGKAGKLPIVPTVDGKEVKDAGDLLPDGDVNVNVHATPVAPKGTTLSPDMIITQNVPGPPASSPGSYLGGAIGFAGGGTDLGPVGPDMPEIHAPNSTWERLILQGRPPWQQVTPQSPPSGSYPGFARGGAWAAGLSPDLSPDPDDPHTNLPNWWRKGFDKNWKGYYPTPWTMPKQVHPFGFAGGGDGEEDDADLTAQMAGIGERTDQLREALGMSEQTLHDQLHHVMPSHVEVVDPYAAPKIGHYSGGGDLVGLADGGDPDEVLPKISDILAGGGTGVLGGLVRGLLKGLGLTLPKKKETSSDDDAGFSPWSSSSSSSASSASTTTSTTSHAGSNQEQVYSAMLAAGFQPSDWDAVNYIVGHESSWSIGAANDWDSNAVAGNPSVGLGQLTLSNYRAAGVDPSTKDAYQQGAAMMSYIKGRYGTIQKAYQHWLVSHNYALGGGVHQGIDDQGNVFGPSGIDTVGPVALPHGSYVVNATQAAKHANLLKKIRGAEAGGPIKAMLTRGEVVFPPGYDHGLLGAINYGLHGFGGGGDGGPPPDRSGEFRDVAGGLSPEIQQIAEMAARFNLRLSSARRAGDDPTAKDSYHLYGEAGDFSNSPPNRTDQELAFANYMADNYGANLSELIHDDPRFHKEINNGQIVPRSFYASAGDHTDHVHIAMKPGAAPNIGQAELGHAMPSGFSPLGQSNQQFQLTSTGVSGGPGGGGTGGFTGTGGSGGGGGGGGSPGGPGSVVVGQGGPMPPGKYNPWTNPPPGLTPEQMRAYTAEVMEWQKHQQDQNAAISKANDEYIAAVQGQAAAATEATGPEKDWLALPPDQRKDQANQESKLYKEYTSTQKDLAAANETLRTTTQALSDKKADQQIEETKGGPKPPTTSGKGGKDGLGEDLGSGIIKGGLQALGFPDVFGKFITDWGIAKIGMKALGDLLPLALQRMPGLGDISAGLPGLPGGLPSAPSPGGLPGGPAVPSPAAPPVDPNGPAATFNQATGQWEQNGHPVSGVSPSSPAASPGGPAAPSAGPSDQPGQVTPPAADAGDPMVTAKDKDGKDVVERQSVAIAQGHSIMPKESAPPAPSAPPEANPPVTPPAPPPPPSGVGGAGGFDPTKFGFNPNDPNVKKALAGPPEHYTGPGPGATGLGLIMQGLQTAFGPIVSGAGNILAGTATGAGQIVNNIPGALEDVGGFLDKYASTQPLGPNRPTINVPPAPRAPGWQPPPAPPPPPTGVLGPGGGTVPRRRPDDDTGAVGPAAGFSFGGSVPTFDLGGVLQPGMNLVQNKTGAPEELHPLGTDAQGHDLLGGGTPDPSASQPTPKKDSSQLYNMFKTFAGMMGSTGQKIMYPAASMSRRSGPNLSNVGGGMPHGVGSSPHPGTSSTIGVGPGGAGPGAAPPPHMPAPPPPPPPPAPPPVGHALGGAIGFDSGGWVHDALQVAASGVDDAATVAAFAFGQVLPKVATRALVGAGGFVLPSIVEAISPSAHTSPDDTTTFSAPNFMNGDMMGGGGNFKGGGAVGFGGGGDVGGAGGLLNEFGSLLGLPSGAPSSGGGSRPPQPLRLPSVGALGGIGAVRGTAGGTGGTTGGIGTAGGGGDMAQRVQAAIQRGAIGPNGELMPSAAAGSEAGLQSNTIRGRRLISALFPELNDIGGVRADPLQWHPKGLALDLMIPGHGGNNDQVSPEGKALGDQINAFIGKNAGALGSDYTMWQVPDHYSHIHANFGASGYPDPNQPQQYFMPPELGFAGGGGAAAPSGLDRISVDLIQWPADAGSVGFAGGGPPGSTDTVAAWLTPDEHVLTVGDVKGAGGHDNIYKWRAGLAPLPQKGTLAASGGKINEGGGISVLPPSALPAAMQARSPELVTAAPPQQPPRQTTWNVNNHGFTDLKSAAPVMTSAQITDSRATY